MQVGAFLVFQNFRDQLSDQEVLQRDLYLAELAEPLGFDLLGVSEHHFFNYNLAPTPIELLCYLAAKTRRIRLLTAAIILPWNDPLRIIEKIVMLDHFSNGRAMFGIGRGLARREYENFGIEMGEARERFDESAEMIMRGLETGIAEGHGRFYKQRRTEVRPHPLKTFKDRFCCVSMSSDSVPGCARLGAQMISFGQKPWDQMVPLFDNYRKLFFEHHKRAAPPPMCAELMVCDESAERAESLARTHMANVFLSVMEHYEMAGDHFKNTKGYGDYANQAAQLKETATSDAALAFAKVNTFGTPQQILHQLDERRQLIGDFDFMIQPSFGGMSRQNAEKSIRLFAEKVMPELQSWKAAA